MTFFVFPESMRAQGSVMKIEKRSNVLNHSFNCERVRQVFFNFEQKM